MSIGTPEVSVVMAVYNDVARVEASVKSVLLQSHRNLELVVVDDGCTDGSAELLDRVAESDPRMRVFHQSNAGLTRSLIRGCEQARGEFIARQDCGDESHRDRIRTQVELVRSRADVVLTACGTAYLGPAGEMLFQVSRPGRELQDGLARLVPGALQGPPHHGACLFRREAYIQVGGYRPTFVVAQDIDLWLRLAEVGQCFGSEEIMYKASVDFGGISQRKGKSQHWLGELAIRCALARRSGISDDRLLSEHESELPHPQKNRSLPRERASYHYFIANCLRIHDAASARRYYRKTLRDDPVHLKAWINLLRTWT